MTFKLNIETDNEAFDEDWKMRNSLEGILENVINKIDEGHTEGICRDINGNNVGDWSITS